MAAFKRVGDLPAEFMSGAATPVAAPAFKRVGDLPPEFTPNDVDPTTAAEMGAAGGGGELLARSDAEATADARHASNFATGAVRTAAQGATLGWSDEAFAMGRRLYEATVGSGRSYESLRDEERDALDAFKSQNPKLALALEIGGGFAVPGAGMARVVASAPSMAGRVVRGAGVGSATGAASGAGNNERGEDFISDAVKGAALGGVVGGVVPAATKAAEAAYDLGGRAVGTMSQNVAEHFAQRRASAKLADAIADDGAVRTGARTASQRAQAADDELARLRTVDPVPTNDLERMLARDKTLGTQAGESVRKLGSEAVAASPVAKNQVMQRVDEIAESRPGEKAYRQMYTGADLSADASQRIVVMAERRPALADAIRIARGQTMNAGGRVGANGAMSPQMVDQVDRSLQDMIGKALRSGATNEGKNLEAVRKSFRLVVDKELPALGKIQQRYASKSAEMRSIEELTRGREVDAGAEQVAAVFGAGMAAINGSNVRLANHVARWLGAKDDAKARAVADVLLTRYGDAAKLTSALDHIRKMAPHQRRAWLDKMAAAGAGAAAASAREYER